MTTINYETLNVTIDGRLVRMEMARPQRLNAVAMTGRGRWSTRPAGSLPTTISAWW